MQKAMHPFRPSSYLYHSAIRPPPPLHTQLAFFRDKRQHRERLAIGMARTTAPLDSAAIGVFIPRAAAPSFLAPKARQAIGKRPRTAFWSWQPRRLEAQVQVCERVELLLMSSSYPFISWRAVETAAAATKVASAELDTLQVEASGLLR